MKTRIHHGLLVCALIAGCAPAQQLNFRGDPTHRPVATPASHPSPEIPNLKRLANGNYRVRQPWTVDVGGRRWCIPVGYTSNGITAPASVKSSLGDGVGHPETWAAVFHDWLFTQPGVSRSQADHLFYELLIAYGVSPAKAGLMHTVVAAYSASKSFR